jgi:hypothetical protein
MKIQLDSSHEQYQAARYNEPENNWPNYKGYSYEQLLECKSQVNAKRKTVEMGSDAYDWLLDCSVAIDLEMAKFLPKMRVTMPSMQEQEWCEREESLTSEEYLR